MMKLLPIILLPCLVFSCRQQSAPTAADFYAMGDKMEEEARGKKLPSTFEAFIAHPEYRNTRDVWYGSALADYAPAQSHVEVLLEEQRGRLYIGGRIAMDFPVCSGRIGGQETPVGSFRISQKVREYRSNRYGSFMSADGKRVVERNISADDTPPPGAVFEGADMPYWMRFNGPIGMHVGKVQRETDSHGCVRIPEEACSILFDKLAVGSRVIVR